MLHNLKTAVKEIPWIYNEIVKIRAEKLEKTYRQFSNYYFKKSKVKGLIYDEMLIKERLHEKIGKWVIKPKPWGELNIFCVEDGGEETRIQLVEGLRKIGTVLTAPWKEWIGITPCAHGWQSKMEEANKILVKEITVAHEKIGIDVVFLAYNIGMLLPDTLKAIRKLKIPTFSYWADDKQNFHAHMGGSPGKCVFAELIDLHWTTAKDCCTWFLCEKGLPLYLPEGANPEILSSDAKLADNKETFDVSFMGQKYGYRDYIINRIKKNGVNIRCFGRGWDGNEIRWEQMGDLFRRSKINLGLGGVSYSNNLVCLKGRDFEVPMAGGLYLTTFNPELAEWFDIGKEILCYRTIDECVELIRYYLTHPIEADLVRQATKSRALRDHKWEDRYRKIFEFMGIIKTAE